MSDFHSAAVLASRPTLWIPRFATILGGSFDSTLASSIALRTPSQAEAAHAAILALHGLSPSLSMPAVQTAPTYRPRRQTIHVFTEGQTRRHRDMALWAHRTGGGRLSVPERRFIGEAIKWKRELLIGQADWLTEIVDRLDWQLRGEAAA